jgi:hypothetical protein
MALGKFEGCADSKLAERLYSITMESGQDDEIGDVQTFGWYAIIKNLGGIGKFKSYIVNEDNYGFFTYTEFNTVKEAGAEFHSLVSDYEQFESEII